MSGNGFIGEGKRFTDREPVEVRIARGTGSMERTLILTAWAAGNGLVGHSLRSANADTPQSLSNLQSRLPFPGKVVPGWQDEVIAFAKGALGRVVEVR